MTTTARGYGIEATLTDESLHVRALSKLFAVSLTGPDLESEVTIPLREIASAHHREPKGFGAVNGLLDIRTAAGKRYQLFYRVKKNADFREFADAVVAAVTPAQSA